MRTWLTSHGLVIRQILAGRSNVFLVTHNGVKLLVDTSPAHRWKTLEKKLNGLNIDKIDLLFLTHSHFDHSDNATRIKNRYGCSIIANSAEEKYFTTGEICTPGGTNYFTRKLLRVLTPVLRDRLSSEPCRPDILFEKELDLSTFGLNAYIIHTPGHSPGSSSLIADGEIALAGDSLFGIFPWSAMPPFGNDRKEIVESWKVLLSTGCRIFLPSHGLRKTREQLVAGAGRLSQNS